MDTNPAFVYIRVSTEDQAANGVSLDAQEARGRSWAEANGLSVRDVFVDAGISGRKASNRPALNRALVAVCDAKAVLVVYSLSRLARSTKDALAIAERLSKAGADLVSLTEKLDTTTAAGKMIFTVFAAFSQFESDLASERTKTALAHKQARGERVGQVPFGYRLAEDGVALQPLENEQKALATLLRLRDDGHSWQRVADELNAQRIPTKKGRKWTWALARSVALNVRRA